MNNVEFEKIDGALGRALAGKDHYAGIIVYEDNKPTGFSSSDIKVLNSIEDAEAAGIKEDATSEKIKALHYHLKRFYKVYEFFGLTPQLWVMIADVPSTSYDYSELETLQDEAGGDIRRFGLYTTEAFGTSSLDTIQSVLQGLENNHKPCSCIVAMDHKTTSDWTTVDDLRELSDNKVHVTIGQDGGAEGASLASSLTASLTDLGSILAISTVKAVHHNIGWVDRYDVAFDGEFDVPALANGDLVKNNESVLQSLHDKGFIFLRKFVGLSGTYFNDSHACTSITSDYAYMENNDVIDKAIRGIRTYVIPSVNRPLTLDADSGKLDETIVGFFENKAAQALDQMVRDGELSGYSVYVDPDQDVLSTSEIVIQVRLVINGVARTIKIPIGFTKQV